MDSFTLEFENPLQGTANEVKADALIRGFMDDIADQAYRLFIKYIPFHTGRTLNALTKGDVNKHPGGLWTVSVGVEEVSSILDKEESYYPLFVHEGTGRHGPISDLYDNEPGFQPLHGNVMVFEKRGEGAIFTRYVQGQKPNPYSDQVNEEMEPYVRIQKRRLAALMDLIVKTS